MKPGAVGGFPGALHGGDLPSSPAILVIRRDNIGDLVLTTPMFESLRRRFPGSYLAALVNSYNSAVLDGNPNLDDVFVYTKRKHLEGVSLTRSLFDRLSLFWRLRLRKFDYVILARNGFAGRALRTARWLAPRHIIGFLDDSCPASAAIDLPVEHAHAGTLHAAEDVHRLLAPLGIEGSVPRATLIADPARVAALRAAMPSSVSQGDGPLVAMHLSSRKEKQRWPAQNFVALARRLRSEHSARFLLFWSPGDDSNPHHPGDDAKAGAVLADLADVPVAPVATSDLAGLAAGLSLADHAILSDGGAMHVAAALGKPLVCFFGNSSAAQWHPWDVPYQLLQKESRDVADISVDETAAAYRSLLQRIRAGADSLRAAPSP